MYSGRRSGAAGLFAVLMLGAAQCGAQGIEHMHAWDRATAGAMDRWCAPCPEGAGSGTVAGLLASQSRPYGIEGLNAYLLEGYYRNEAGYFRGEWGVLDHALYREDRFLLGFGICVRRRTLFIGQQAGALRQGVEGTQRTNRYRTASTVLLCIENNFLIDIEIETQQNSYQPPCAFRFLLRMQGIDLLFRCSGGRMAVSDPRAGVRLKISSRLFLLLGFRATTDEVCAGVVAISGKTVAGFGWNSHPVLGETCSAGIGRLWRK